MLAAIFNSGTSNTKQQLKKKKGKPSGFQVLPDFGILNMGSCNVQKLTAAIKPCIIMLQ
jgi:hypothetical protein